VKTFRERLAAAARQGELAWALAHLLVKGDTSHFSEDLLRGDIDLDSDVLFEHIEHVKKRTSQNIW